ncbi:MULTISPECIES: hypothetical protein [unclassified Streptomyces]|uniref:hypothetical protein n=1 Tax=unclassified Streptomyces TaxID=2593676 RepID=UPI000711085B|nr:hypothetical protein [Streptomyces sp. Root1310]KQX65030.1 hypothetical protein ASD48_18190 [Streptomyces sp. Root1310]
MSLGPVVPKPLDGSVRFFSVAYLPTYAATVFVLLLVWAGAPGADVSLRRAWRTATEVGAGQAVWIVVGTTVVAVLFQPFQLAVVRLLEGGWPEALGAGPLRALQRRRRARLAGRAELAGPAGESSPAQVQRAGAAAAALRRRYPLPDHLVRPTALGNVLAALRDTAGRDHGWDATVAWPRLYPVLGDRARAVVDDGRDSLDAAARLCVTTAVTALLSAGLLFRSGWWMLLALAPAAVALLAYHGAVQAALTYGDAVLAAFELHRFDLLRALHLPLPDSLREERTLAEALCLHWRQGLPPPSRYLHPVDSPPPPAT